MRLPRSSITPWAAHLQTAGAPQAAQAGPGIFHTVRPASARGKDVTGIGLAEPVPM